MNKKFLGPLVLGLALIAPSVLAVSADITQINFTNLARTVDTNTSSKVLTTQTQNSGNTEEKVTETGTTLNLSSTSGTGEFSLNDITWIPVITLTMASGTANRNFYYRDSVTGTSTLTVTAEGKSWTEANQIITISAPVVTLTGITITTPASKLSYFVDDLLDITGLVVTGIYSDASTSTMAVVEGDITGFDSSAPAVCQVLTITLDGQTTTYVVDIISVPVVIEPVVETPPSSGSHSSGYVLGWGPNGPINPVLGQVLGTSTSRVLGASKSKAPGVTREKRLLIIKKRLDLIHHQALILKHQQQQTLLKRLQNLQQQLDNLKNPNAKVKAKPVATQAITINGTGEVINPVDESGSTATTTAPVTPTKPWWKFW